MNETLLPEHSTSLIPLSQVSAGLGDLTTRDAARTNPLTMANLLAAIWRHKLLFGVSFILVFAAVVGVISQLTPRFTSEALLMVNPRETHITNIQSVQEAPSGLSDLNFVRSEMQVLDNDGLAREVIHKLDLQDDPEFKAPSNRIGDWVAAWLARLGLRADQRPPSAEERTAATIAAYEQRFSTFNDARSFTIAASFSARDPGLARRILETHIQTYLDDQRATKEAIVNKAESWFDTELAQLQTQVLQSEAKQRQFRLDHGLMQVGGETMTNRQLAEVAEQVTAAQVDLVRKNARSAELSSLVSDHAPAATTSDTALQSSDLLQRLRTEESRASQSVAELSARFGSSYPSVRAARAYLADVSAHAAAQRLQLVDSAKRDAQVAKGNLDALQTIQTQLEAKLQAISAAELTSNQLAREADADRRLYDDLLSRSKQVAVQRETQQPDAVLVSNASLPLSPSFPRVGILSAMAVVGAALLASLFALLRDLSEPKTFDSLHDIEMKAGVPGLAAIPLIKFGRKKTAKIAPQSQLTAAFQTLRNSIFFYCRADRSNVIVFSSAMEQDGKSVTSMLFARSLAMKGKRVLLVDGDLRGGGLSHLLVMSNAPGLSDVLQLNATLIRCVERDTETGLDVLPRSNNPVAPEIVLDPERIRNFLAEARSMYDLVIIDTPALATFDDALPFAALADATVLVVRWSTTNVTVVDGAIRRLRSAGANVIGALLNAVDPAKYRAPGLETYRLLASGSPVAGR